jgi:RNA polymerase sigma-70 factor (ECF subfamily)
METTPSDARLVELAPGGDVAAFDALVRRYLRSGLSVAWEFVEERHDAEDILQDAFVRVLDGIASFDARRPFAPWFFTILRNVARNTARTRGRWEYVPLPDSVPDDGPATDPAERAELRDRVQDLLESMPPVQRACFRLCELEGFSRSEVANMMGVRESTVRVHIHRARGTLRESLGALRGEGKRP